MSGRGFLDIAREESIDTILQAAELKKSGNLSELVVMGCLSERFPDEIAKEIPEIDRIFGSNSKVVVGSDTGLLHIAEALGITVNMILGPTSKETGGGVNLKSSKNIEVDIWCRPCSQNGQKYCYRSKQYCMERISPNKVASIVMKSL